MNITDDKTDIKFRRLFEKAGLESPSSGFTGDVMKKIADLGPETEKATAKNLFLSWIGGIGIGVLAILGISLMYYLGAGILPESFKPLLSPIFGNIYNSFKGIFDSVEVSDTTIAIILGFAFLVILERILGRLKFMKNIYFSL